MAPATQPTPLHTEAHMEDHMDHTPETMEGEATEAMEDVGLPEDTDEDIPGNITYPVDGEMQLYMEPSYRLFKCYDLRAEFSGRRPVNRSD